MIIYKCYSNFRIPSIVDCRYEQYVSQTILYPNIQETLQDKEAQLKGNQTKKQVY